MNFFVIILLNIVLWVIFYLVISLKLEKSAADFREKRLHEEMNKIIKEFNVTADRNISLLENKIRVLQNLLKQHEHTTPLDIIVGDKEISVYKDFDKNKNQTALSSEELVSSENQHSSYKMSHQETGDGDSIFSLINKVMSGFFKKKSVKPARQSHPIEILHDYNNEKIFQSTFKTPASHEPSEYTIEKEYDQHENFEAGYEEHDQTGETGIDQEEIIKIINAEMNIHDVINTLHEKGLQAVEISRYTGMPEGEIKLVLNLNSSK